MLLLLVYCLLLLPSCVEVMCLSLFCDSYLCPFLFSNDLSVGEKVGCFTLTVLLLPYTVNPEIFERILFSRYALKDIFATLKNRDWGMIYLYQ